MEPPPPEERRLHDGTRLVLRPIEPGDKERLRQGMRQLSRRSRYHRFLATVAELSPQQLRYLTEIDYVDHMAWIALDPGPPGAPAVGVARYIRLPHEPGVAEVAVTVLDGWQRRGIGTLLVERLGRSATDHGIGAFRAHVLEGNAGALRMLARRGALAVERDGNLLRFDVPAYRTAAVQEGSHVSLPIPG